MTLDNIVDRIWENLGEPTDLDPSTAAGLALLTWVANEGQRQVAKWKDQNTGRPARINDLFGDPIYYQSSVNTDTIAAVTSTSIFTLTSASANDDRYNGWILEVTSGDADGERRIIIDYTGSTRTVTLHKALTNTPTAADTVKLYKNFDKLLPSTHTWVGDHILLPAETDVSRDTGNLLEVLSIVDMEQEIELKPAEKTAKYVGNITQSGNPSFWYSYGNTIYYDVGVDDTRTFKMEYYRLPMEMVSITDTPDIPVTYHWAIILWGTWWGHVRAMESSKAYSLKMDFESEMRKTINQFELRKERLDLKGVMKYDESD